MSVSKTESQVIFHCGLPKTGSTYLQQAVFPKCQGGTYVSGKWGFTHFVNFLSSARGSVLVSDERLAWTPLERSDFENGRREKALAYLANTWPRSKLLLFLREPSEMIKSHYAQYLHDGGPLAFPNFYERYIHHDAFRFERLLDTVSGQPWQDVLLVDYRELMANPDRVIAMIEAYTGLAFPGWNVQTRKKAVNTSVNGYGAALLRMCNVYMVSRFDPQRVGRFQRLDARRHKIRLLLQSRALRFLNRLGPPLIPQETLDGIKADFRDSWEEVQRRIATSQVDRQLGA